MPCIRERLAVILCKGASEAGLDCITKTSGGQRIGASDIVGIWNNRVPDVIPELKKNVVGVISQVGRGKCCHRHFQYMIVS